MHVARGIAMEDFGGALSRLWSLASAAAIVGTVAGWFPYFAAFVGLCYYLLQIYESATLQTWFHTRRLRKLASLKKLVASLEAQELKALHRKAAKAEKEAADE